MIYNLAALSIGILWALGFFFAYYPIKSWGNLRFNTLRFLFSAVVVFFLIVFINGFNSLIIPLDVFFIVLLSGALALFFGDFLLYYCISEIGPRKATVIYSLNAPLTLIIGLIFNTGHYSYYDIIGIILVLAGIVISVYFQKSSHEIDPKGNLKKGVMLGILAALLQAISLNILEKPLQVADPFAISFWRLGFTGLLFLLCYFYFKNDKTNKYNRLPFFPSVKKYNKEYKILLFHCITALIMGSSLVAFALMGGQPGVVASFTSLNPVFILPIQWLVTKQKLDLTSWLGALLAVIGSIIMFNL